MQAPREQSVAPKCAGGCGFYGSPTTENYCSVCYKRRLSSMGANAVNAPSAKSSSPPPAGESRPNVEPAERRSPAIATMPTEVAGPSVVEEGAASNPASCAMVEADTGEDGEGGESKSAPASEVNQQDPSRCYKCNKRVGLLAFKCRCGAIFCRPHLHAEEHGCTFDYQTMARQSLESRNPRIYTDKLDRI